MTQREMVGLMRDFLDGPLKAGKDDSRPTWNVKPTNQVRMIIADGAGAEVNSARWWFVPHWFKDDPREWKPTTFNARIETASQKPTFRTAWASGRCAIPALGYYEWTGPKAARTPNYITVDTNLSLLFFAGLFSQLPDGQRTCTILTREAAPEIAHLHHRMPVILTAGEIDRWLRGDIGTTEAQNALGTGWDGRFRFHEVAPIKRDDDGPELIEPVGRLL